MDAEFQNGEKGGAALSRNSYRTNRNMPRVALPQLDRVEGGRTGKGRARKPSGDLGVRKIGSAHVVGELAPSREVKGWKKVDEGVLEGVGKWANLETNQSKGGG